MATTPPPAKRTRTPPTPMHGPKTDAYEPYSPRRSSRINQKHYISGTKDTMTSSTIGQQRTLPKQRSTMKRTSSQTFSPPSSPLSPPSQSLRMSSTKQKAELFGLDSDTDMHGGPADKQGSSLFGGRGNLPTPAKTPKKRSTANESTLASTSRVLFPSRPIEADEIMPSPRKARGKKHTAFTLQSFAEESDRNGEDIAIFTDSKERVPDADESEDNPFVVRRSARAGRTQRLPEPRHANGTKYGMTKEIDEAVENNEGMVYVFRGKKMFRRFDDAPQASSEARDSFSDRELRTHAGAEARRPFTRSAMAPRLLFPPIASEVDDEEAVTDIEGAANPEVSDMEHDRYVGLESNQVSTPAKVDFRPTTPPTTGRKARKSIIKLTPESSPAGPSSVTNNFGNDPATETMRNGRARRNSPFDAWQRTKPGVGGSSMKRQAEPIDRELIDGGTPKRSKAGANRTHAISGAE